MDAKKNTAFKKITVLIIVLLHIAVFYLYFKDIFLFHWQEDDGLLLDGATRILSGQIPLKDFFYFHLPGDIYLLALFFKVFGTSYITAKSMMFLFSLLAGICLIRIVYKFSGEIILPGIVSLFYFVTIPAYMTVSHDWLSIFFVIFTLWSLFEYESNHRKKFLFIAGVLGGLTCLIHESRGVGTVLLFSFYLLAMAPAAGDFRQKLRKGFNKVLVFLSGAGVILGIAVIYLFLSGSFVPYLHTIGWMFTNYEAFNRYPFLYNEIAVIKQAFHTPDWVTIWHGIDIAFTIANILLFPLLLSLLVMFRYGRKTDIGTSFSRENILVLLSAAYLVLFLSALYKPELWRMALFPLPVTFGLLSCAGFLYIKGKMDRKEKWQKILIKPMPVLFLILCGGIISANTEGFGRMVAEPKCTLTMHHNTVMFDAGSDYCAAYKDISGRIADKPDQPIFVYYWHPILYFLLNRKNAASFDSYVPVYNTQEQMQQIVNELKSVKPYFIIKDGYVLALQNPASMDYRIMLMVNRSLLNNDPVGHYINDHYTVDKSYKGLFLLRRIEKYDSIKLNGAREKLRRLGIKYSLKEFIASIQQDNAKLVGLFIEAGMNPNARNVDNTTPLILAASEDHGKTVNVLLAHGADVNARRDNGDTALIYASANGYTGIVKALLRAGADVNIRNNSGITARMAADRFGHADIVSLLIAAGARE